MTINSDRYLQLMLASCIALPVWFIGLSFFDIEFEYLWVVILITALIILSIIVWFIVYLMEIIEPHENDIFMEFFTFTKPPSITKFILLAGLSSMLGYIYWFVKSHINFQTNKHIGIELFGGKRKGSTHHKK
jgi:hypothetical protein